MGGACTNAADLGIVTTTDVSGIASTCGVQNITDLTKVKGCIIDGTKGDAGPGLSDGCATCFSDTVLCTVDKCIGPTFNGPCMPPNQNSAACTDCRATNCNPAFYTCTGLPQSN